MAVERSRLAAASVHLLTACGAGAGMLALTAISGGKYGRALAWMALAVAIDGVDGTLARRARVADALPAVDGALLDNIVDYLNYAVVPALLLGHAGLLPQGVDAWAAASICSVSALQLAQSDAKTADHYFKGFPSYWNVVAFYLLLLGWPRWVNLLVVVVLCISVFVPVYYVYPGRTRPYRTLTLTLTGVWAACGLLLLFEYPVTRPWLLYGSLSYVVYYYGLSLLLTARR